MTVRTVNINPNPLPLFCCLFTGRLANTSLANCFRRHPPDGYSGDGESLPPVFGFQYANASIQFLLADSILLALDNVTNGLVIYPNVIRSHIDQELPFSTLFLASLFVELVADAVTEIVATESILMKLAQHGVSRQEAHEEIRVLVCHNIPQAIL